MRFRMDFSSLPRCGAKARSNGGRPCRQAAMSNGRCYYHGGKSVVKNGKYTKQMKKAMKEQRAFIDKTRNFLKKLKKEN